MPEVPRRRRVRRSDGTCWKRLDVRGASVVRQRVRSPVGDVKLLVNRFRVVAVELPLARPRPIKGEIVQRGYEPAVVHHEVVIPRINPGEMWRLGTELAAVGHSSKHVQFHVLLTHRVHLVLYSVNGVRYMCLTSVVAHGRGDSISELLGREGEGRRVISRPPLQRERCNTEGSFGARQTSSRQGRLRKMIGMRLNLPLSPSSY